MTTKRNLRAIVITGLVAFSVLAVGLGPVQAQEAGNASTATTGDAAACAGTPTMAQTYITSPRNVITADSPGLIEANFRAGETVPEDCPIVVDLQYSFSQSGFQFEGGSFWDQPRLDIVTTEFTVSPGEIHSIDAEIAANGASVGDNVTVVVDYEIWYQGNRDDSRKITGIRRDFQVQESGSIYVNNQSTPSPIVDPGPPGIVEFISQNLVPVLFLVSIGVIAIVLVWGGPYAPLVIN